ncbi:hypothetical protein E2K80_04905 [Rhodophyticola sp. CCM32]|uniref:hypothetical protein n=1 Tax=Rhodophyticola sp. CCM32 TaxID=2916397 RepID=UPI00107FA8A5|nr:hypothetical protein [Rhodophyticola sp. CCM32]QBY00157.1 hypothetical protein E2K80_04905 [Rhodophyticola sp. CCM32]
MNRRCLPLSGFVACCGLAGCVSSFPVDDPNRAAFYDGVETRLLDDDLVNFHVQMTGMATRADVEDYAKCAAAQYALIRGYGFARHVRTNVQEEGGVWRGDAVYTISPALPRGLQTLDAEVVAAACAEQGIPTV